MRERRGRGAARLGGTCTVNGVPILSITGYQPLGAVRSWCGGDHPDWMNHKAHPLRCLPLVLRTACLNVVELLTRFLRLEISFYHWQIMARKTPFSGKMSTRLSVNAAPNGTLAPWGGKGAGSRARRGMAATLRCDILPCNAISRATGPRKRAVQNTPQQRNESKALLSDFDPILSRLMGLLCQGAAGGSGWCGRCLT